MSLLQGRITQGDESDEGPMSINMSEILTLLRDATLDDYAALLSHIDAELQVKARLRFDKYGPDDEEAVTIEEAAYKIKDASLYLKGR